MSLLLCSYASERSRTEKIESWIAELVRLREQRSVDERQRETIDILLTRAQCWLGAKSRN